MASKVEREIQQDFADLERGGLISRTWDPNIMDYRVRPTEKLLRILPEVLALQEMEADQGRRSKVWAWLLRKLRRGER